ncbi:hypothetical protein EYR36_002828 [Pleurotus pulmonarius]|nr:hypothetical protein EYR36_002828 [Pleurotus pulmonarius]
MLTPRPHLALEVTTSPSQTLSPPSLAIISPTPRAFTFPINTPSHSLHSSLSDHSLHSLDPLSESPFSSPHASPYPSPFSSPLGTPSHSPAPSPHHSRASSPCMLQEPFQFDAHFARSRSLSKASLHVPHAQIGVPSPLRDNGDQGEEDEERDASRERNGEKSERGESKDRSDRGDRGEKEKEKERRPKKGDEDYIKRPENAFILFRRNLALPITVLGVSFPFALRFSLIEFIEHPHLTREETAPGRPLEDDLAAVEGARARGKAVLGGAREGEEARARADVPRVCVPPAEGGQAGGSSSKLNAGSKEEKTLKDGGKESKDGKGRKNSMVSVASTDADDDEDRDEDAPTQDDKAGKTLSFVVPTLPSPPPHHSHHSSYTQHLSPFDAIATQLSSAQTQGQSQGQQGQQAYNRPAYHGRSASAPTPPPFSTLSPLLQQHQQQHQQQQYQSFPQDPSQYNAYAADQYHAQQGYGQQWFGYGGGVGMGGGGVGMGGGGVGMGGMGGMGQQHIQIPNVYNSPNANSCPTSPSPNNTSNTSNISNVGGMNMLPTSPTTDVPMISGARRGSAPGHASASGDAFESSDFLRGMYNMSASLPHSLSRKPLSLSTLSTSSLSPLSTSLSTSTSVSALSASPASSGPPSPSSLSSAFERSSLHDGANACGDVNMGVDYGMGMGMEYGVVGSGMGGIGGMGEEYAGFHGFGGDAYGFNGFSGTVHGWSHSDGNNHHNVEGESGNGASGKSLSTTPTPQMFSPSQHDQQQNSAYSPSTYAQNEASYNTYTAYPEFGNMGGMSGGMGGGMGMGMGVFMPDDFDIAAIQTVEFGLPPTSNSSLSSSSAADSQPSSDASSKFEPPVQEYEHHQVEEHAEYGMNGGMGNMGGMGGMGMDTDMQGAVNV